MTGVDIDGNPYKLVIARDTQTNAVLAWFGPFRATEAEAERERIAKGARDNVTVTIEDDRRLGASYEAS